MIYFSLNELMHSDTATKMKINNDCSGNFQICYNLTKLIDNVLDPARKLLGEPIIVTSGYRCEELNKIVGGAKNSQHLYGQAADIICPFKMRELWNILCDMDFDQLIWENGGKWIHISYRGDNPQKNRRMVL